MIGTSVVRGDPEHAVMRATLDALNRRVAELFPAVSTAGAELDGDVGEGVDESADGSAA